MKNIKLSLFLLTVLSFIQVSCNKNTSSKCDLIPDSGSCEAAFPKYYFDSDEGKCKAFFWGGCDGTVPFETLEECQECDCNK